MAENLDSPSFGNFSIENTMEMGVGSAELLNDLMSPETASSSPDDIKEIKEEAQTEATTPSESTTSAKSPKKSQDAPDAKKEDETAKKSLQEFLLGDDEEEEEKEEEKPIAKSTKEKSKPAEEQAPEKAPEEEEELSEEEIEGNKFKALSNDLFKLGVFSKDEDEEDIDINSPEKFLERFQEEKKKGAIDMVQNFISQFGEDYQQAFDAIFVKGVNPKEYFGAYNTAVSFSEMDLSDESNQIAVIKKALSDQGFDPEDVSTEIERLKNYGDLETVAQKHHKVLVKKETAKMHELEQRSQMELQQKAAVRNQYIQNVQAVLQDKLKTKEFDGIPINPTLASELQDFLLVDKYKTQSGETLTDFDRTILELKRPENHEMKVKVGLLLKILEKDPTLSTIQRSGISKKSDKLFSEVARQVTKSGSKSSGSAKSQSSSWFL
jgi:hypothetical protein